MPNLQAMLPSSPHLSFYHHNSLREGGSLAVDMPSVGPADNIGPAADILLAVGNHLGVHNLAEAPRNHSGVQVAGYKARHYDMATRVVDMAIHHSILSRLVVPPPCVLVVVGMGTVLVSPLRRLGQRRDEFVVLRRRVVPRKVDRFCSSLRDQWQ